ncbi:MAG: NADP-binding protein [Kosmotoga sp.]|nr:MAG: NADP-binding protein [Kosmotoga sp.]
MAYRVLVWGLGAMGTGIARNVFSKKYLRLVGAVEINKEFIGKDIGAVIGEEEYGAKIYNDPEKAINETNPDVVIIATNSFMKEVEPKILLVLNHSVNVVTIAEEMAYPFYSHPESSEIIHNTAVRNGVTVVGTGINPGFIMDVLAVALSGTCLKVNRVFARRVNDLSPFGKTVMETQGVGTTPEEFNEGLEKGTIVGHIGFQQSIRMIGDALGWELTKIEETREPIISKTKRSTAVVSVEPGMVAGCKHIGKGYIDDDPVIELVHPQQIQPEKESVETGDYIIIEGQPRINLSIQPEIPGGIGTIAVATNVIGDLVEAEPGFISMLELPVPRMMANH